jgi:hypothetical protein
VDEPIGLEPVGIEMAATLLLVSVAAVRVVVLIV